MDLSRIPDSINANDLTDTLLEHWGLRFDTDLEQELGIARGSVNQYRKRQTTDIQTKIIIALLRDIAYLENKASTR